jgi:hypothetical protein
MTDQQRDTENGTDAPLATTRLVESLLEKALEMRKRAADTGDASWRQFYETGAAAYDEWALKIQALASLQAQIEEKTAMIKLRFGLKGGASKEE